MNILAMNMIKKILLLILMIELMSYSLPETVELNVKLHKGWNLLTFPVHNVSYDKNIKLYNKIGEKYILVKEPIPGEGYWVFSKNDEQLNFSGRPVYKITLHLKKGKPVYIGGPACEIPSPIETYTYNTSSRNFVPVNRMTPGYGYYVLPKEDITVRLECQKHESIVKTTCNYNGVCEPERGENISSCSNDCWLPRIRAFYKNFRDRDNDYDRYNIFDELRQALLDLLKRRCGDRVCSPLENEETCPVDCAPGHGWTQYKGNHLRDSTTSNYGAISGEISWEVNLSSRFASSPIVDENERFVLINEYYDNRSVYISAYKTNNGERKWTTQIGSWRRTTTTTPAVYKDRVFTESDDGFYAINLTTGRIIFTDLRPPSYRPPILILPGKDTISPNNLYEGVLVVYVSENNTIVVRNAVNYGRVWETQLENTHFSSEEERFPQKIGLLAGDDSTIYVVAYHNVSDEYKRWIYAIDRRTGEIRWSSLIPMRFYTAYPINDVTVGKDWVMTLSNQEGAAVKFNKTDGSYVWSNTILGEPPYNFVPYISPSGPWGLLDENTYASKTGGRLGIFKDRVSPSGDLYGDHTGTFQPADPPDRLEEYQPFCIVISNLSRQIIVPFLSTYETRTEDGEFVPHPYFNSIYSISLDEAIDGGEFSDWNWKTQPFLFSRGPTGCPAMDSKHVYVITRHPVCDFPARLICIE